MISSFFEDISIWLTLLKYVGISLAAGSSIWGTTNELTKKTKGGRPRLTKAGVVAISFTLLGLVVSLASEDLQRRESKVQAAANARRTNEIIISGQPLTSLSLSWQFSSASDALRQTMRKGQKASRENDESSQGGTPRVPFGIEEYQDALIPLVTYVARLGEPPDTDNTAQSKPKAADGDAVVLIALDPSFNSILAFGLIGSGPTWYDTDKTKAKKDLPAGFPKWPADDFSTVHASFNLDRDRNGASTYGVSWDLDPGSLAAAINRVNSKLTPTAKLPPLLKVAILYDIKVLPFIQNDFAQPSANIWRSLSDEGTKATLPAGGFTDATIALEVNDYRESTSRYAFKKMYHLALSDQFDDPIDTKCAVLEFEIVSR